MASWASVEIDRETETGYEKSTVLGGNKAFEKYDTRSRRGEIKVLVGGRFIAERYRLAAQRIAPARWARNCASA